MTEVLRQYQIASACHAHESRYGLL